MFLRICRGSTVDQDAHKPKGKKTMPSIPNPFQNHAKKAPKLASPSPPSKEVSPIASPSSKISKKPSAHSGRIGARKDFLKVTTRGLGTEEIYSNPESLPSLEVAYQNFKQVYSRFSETVAVDRLREREYGHLGEREHVCLDYSGFGLFSHWQQVFQRASSSFGLAYISANLPTHALYGTAEQGTVEAYIRSRIMAFLNISDQDYSMVFTASRGSAYKLLAESYPFHINNRLLTVYDYESDAVSWMIATAKEKGAKVMNAAFKWPHLKIAASDLKYKLQDKKKKKEQTAKGLFVFPVQSRLTGAKYSYQWMSQAQANRWHVLLDASALGPKDMDSLGLSLFRPEFIVTSFYKVFGADPTGFGCLFIKNTTIQGLHTSSRARGVGMVRIIPSGATILSPVRSEGEKEQEQIPEVDEEYMDADDWAAGKFVDPVSSFSGPVTQFYVQDVKEKEILSRIAGPRSELNIAGFDDGSSRSSEIEEEGGAVDRMQGETSRVSEMETVYEGSGEFHDSGSCSLESNDARPSIPEIKEEDQGPIFPLTRRSQHTRKKQAIALTETNEHAPSNGMDHSSVVLSREIGEDEHSETSRFQGNSDQYLSRIQEEAVGEGNETMSIYTPHRKRLNSADNAESRSVENGTLGGYSPIFHSPLETSEGFSNGNDHDHGSEVSQKTGLYNDERQIGREDGKALESDKIAANIMFKDDRDHALREGREVESVFRQGRTHSFGHEDFERDDHLGASDEEGYSGTNGRRLQYWSPGEGSNQWADQYAMSVEGSPLYYDNDDGVTAESDGDPMDEEAPILCTGLDHADSQGLNKTNLRLRFLINWLINSLLKLRHPAKMEIQGAPLVHIYGPQVQFDRGASVAFNVFDWNGVLVETDLVQRLADRSNISLKLGTLCNIVYPEGSEDLPGLGFSDNKGTQGASAEGKPETPRASNANKGDRPSSIPVVTASLGFVSTFEDVYRLWAFVAKFLDADFVSREGWRYHSLNQETVVL